MKNYFEILGVTKEDSVEAINKAYKKLAFIYHPDKAKNPVEKIQSEIMMRLLNEAKDVLCNAEKKQKYAIGVEFFEEKPSYLKPYVPMLGPGNTQPFSTSYRKSHQSSILKFTSNPLLCRTLTKTIPYQSNIYTTSGKSQATYSDIFSFIRARKNDPETQMDINFDTILTPRIATQLFMHFLAGKYYKNNLVHLKKYLSNQIARIKADSTEFFRKPYYESICEIVFMTEEKPSEKLLSILEKIAAYAQKIPEYERMIVLPLFHNKYYRNLHAFALHMKLHASSNRVDKSYFSRFDGSKEARSFMEEKKEKFLLKPDDENLLAHVRLARMIMDFERDLQNPAKPEKTAADYRERAFHFIDWISSIMETIGSAMLHNLFLQIASTFQQASQIENKPAWKMADEEMAMRFYMQAYARSDFLSPDAEAYIFTHVVSNLRLFKYALPNIEAIQEIFEKRLYLLTNIFPFVEPQQSNISWFTKSNSIINVMQDLLHLLHKQLEDSLKPNPGTKKSIQLPHLASTILYQCYEACLKNWYEEKHNPSLENKFRLDLMMALLVEKNTGFESIHKYLLSPSIMVHRDEKGFLTFPGSCAFKDNSQFPVYRSIQGFEVNHNTGEIVFFLDKWQSHYKPYEKAFNAYDFQQMLEKNIMSAIFSLDLVDPDKPYHPFNAMRFSKSIYETELLHVMCLVDVILKYMTTGQEIAGVYPFDKRPVANMIQSLPEYLRKIIEDYQKTKHHGHIHRFWVEAVHINVIKDKEALSNDNLSRISLGDMRMELKTKQMERDASGDVIDMDSDEEGWPIYVLTSGEMQTLLQGKRIIAGSAMIFIYGQAQLYYWQDDAILQAFIPKNSRENLIRLFKLQKGPQGKIPVTSENMPLLYRLTTDMAEQSGQSHQYSPEFIFAYQFTRHFDEFSQCIPELYRLKELSKILIVIQELNQIRTFNNYEKEALHGVLHNTTKITNPPVYKIYKFYKQQYQEKYTHLQSELTRLRGSLATSIFQTDWQNKLSEIRDQIGTLSFDSDSPEVIEIANDMFRKLSRNNPYIPAQRLWKGINHSEIASSLTQHKWENSKNSLYELFKNHLSDFDETDLINIIENFLNGFPKELEDALVTVDRFKAVNKIAAQFPQQSTQTISDALDDHGHKKGVYVANSEATRSINDQYQSKLRMEAGFFSTGLGKNPNAVSVENQTFWVPAVIRHDIKIDISQQTIANEFVYGGVNLQAKTTYLYQQVGANGEHLKFGVTVNPHTRYTAAELNGGRLRIVAEGKRSDMLKLERDCHTYLPIGPNERQSQYVKIQAAMGYKTPPYF